MATTPGRAHRSAAPTTSTATRGIILVACAVFIGVLLLWKGGGDQTVNAAGFADYLQKQAKNRPVAVPISGR
jgi:hypothetical protein